MAVRDVIIVGAGPAGLATAIAARQRGLDHQVVEQGGIVDAIYRYPTHMSFFTTPELLEIGGMPLVTPYEKPTRLEALRYYRKVTEAYQLQVTLHEKVTAVTAVGSSDDPLFAVESIGRQGHARVRESRAVVLAMGYFDHPNRLGVPGEDLPHVSHYYKEAHPFYRQRVVVVGGKNSAAEAALELYRAGAHVTLVHRGPTLGDSDAAETRQHPVATSMEIRQQSVTLDLRAEARAQPEPTRPEVASDESMFDAAATRDLGHGLLERTLRAPADDRGGARVGELARDGGPEDPATAGHDRDVVLEHGATWCRDRVSGARALRPTSSSGATRRLRRPGSRPCSRR